MANTIVVIARREDRSAQAFVERYAAAGACLMTPEDLSVVGWRHQPGAIARSTAVVGGRRLSRDEITGVVTRLSCVTAYDVGHIVAADRSYVAAEMTAFLRSWLTELPCPILNRPTPNCLSGPYWSHAKWVLIASRLGLPTKPFCRRLTRSVTPAATAEEQAAETPVTVLGSQYVGDVHPIVGQQACQLAHAVGVDVLTAYFSGSEPGARFMRADLCPDISGDEITEAIIAFFGNKQ